MRCGDFDIAYSNYNKYNKNLQFMAEEISRQNATMRPHWDLGSFVYYNLELCGRLGISIPPEQYHRVYEDLKVQVKIY